MILRTHIEELEALRDDLLVEAKMGSSFARKLMVALHRVVIEKRNLLRGRVERT
ncbi:MAG: hypothetical protein O7G87_12120 [bacterium]|nr:hypothetical protein [bacterium]